MPASLDQVAAVRVVSLAGVFPADIVAAAASASARPAAIEVERDTVVTAAAAATGAATGIGVVTGMATAAMVMDSAWVLGLAMVWAIRGTAATTTILTTRLTIHRIRRMITVTIPATTMPLP